MPSLRMTPSRETDESTLDVPVIAERFGVIGGTTCHASGSDRLQVSEAAIMHLAPVIFLIVVINRIDRYAATAYRLWLGIWRLAHIFGSSKDAQSTRKTRP